MHAHLRSARLAPKKANIMARMVRGLTIPDAMELLRKTSKKSARLFEGVLRSAIANAEHNFKQNAQQMIVKTVIVNQGTAYRRGIPMARGRVRPIKKFLCHISVSLGYAEGSGRGEETGEGNQKKQRKQKNQKSEIALQPQNPHRSSPKKAEKKSFASFASFASS